MSFQRYLAVLTLWVAASMPTISVASDSYPSRPITWVIPFAAGGSTDVNARFLANFLREELGQPIVVENKTGAGSVVGAEAVVNAKPDGYTFLYGSNLNIVSYEYLFKKPSYDPKTALLPFHGLMASPPTLIMRADAPFKSVPELVAYAKQNPNKVNFATPGVNSSPHLVTELFMAEAGIKMTHIPYRGSAPAIADLLAGTVDIIFDFPTTLQGHLETGKLRALAVPGNERIASMPTIPTFAESGLPGVNYTTWSIMAFPAGTPRPMVDRMTVAFDRVLRKPEVKKFFADQGGTIMYLAKDELAAFINAERVKMKSIITRANIQPE